MAIFLVPSLSILKHVMQPIMILYVEKINILYVFRRVKIQKVIGIVAKITVNFIRINPDKL